MPGKNNTTNNGGKKVATVTIKLPLPFFSSCNASAQKSVRHSETPRKEVNTQMDVNKSTKKLMECDETESFKAFTKPLVELPDFRMEVRSSVCTTPMITKSHAM